MTVKFSRVPYGNVQARPFLDAALQRTPSNGQTIEQVLNGGDVYLIHTDEEAIGATYIEYQDIGYGPMINVVLLSGNKIHEWRNDYSDFIRELAEKNKTKYVCVIGRNGWHRIFDELTPIGTIYMADALPNLNG